MRLFVAIELSEEIKDELVKVQGRLQDAGAFGGNTKRENLHLTLDFIDEYKYADKVLDVLDHIDFGDIKIKLTHIGNFDDLYWVGVEEDSELEKLVKRIRRAFADNGIPFDRKKFYPHITIVRGVFYDGKGLPDVSVEAIEMNVEQISLMRSDRGKSGIIYTCVGVIPES